MIIYFLPQALLLLLVGCRDAASNAEKALKEPEIKTTDLAEHVQSAEEKQEEKVWKKSIIPSLFILEPSTEVDFEKAKANYTDSFISDTLKIRKVSGKLKLKTNEKWKPYVIYTDTLLGTDNDEIREYTYLGQYKELNKYLVGGSFWEHYECYLIDKGNGKTTTLWDRPYISPDKNLLACLSMTYGLEGVPNGIQIWRAVRNENNQIEPITLEKYIEIDQQVWAPYDFYWDTSNSIVLKILSVGRYGEVNGEPKESDFSFLRLTLK